VPPQKPHASGTSVPSGDLAGLAYLVGLLLVLLIVYGHPDN
jgi:hypothetical protein